jgi:hypothetical protein
MKHTPGPWAAELGRDGSFLIEADRQGVTGGLLVLASRNEHPLLAEQMHANARLIAAAPDLLEALQEMYQAFNWGDMNQGETWAILKARAAIAKATND